MRLLILMAMVVTACAQRPDPVAARPSGSATSAATASSAALPLCRTDQVTGTFEQWGAAAGSNVGEFRLAPVDDARCGLPANPVHRFITKYGGRALLETPPPPPTLAPLVPLVTPQGKASTFVTLQWSNHGAEPGWSCHDRMPMAGIEIELGSEWLPLSFASSPVGICTDPVEHVSVLVVAPRS